MKSKGSKIYLCENCGNEFSTWSGRCPVCSEWNTLKEVEFQEISSFDHGKISGVDIQKLKEIDLGSNFRTKSGIGEFDRVLGGGVVPGSVILLGGEPGIGKSTLLLQIADSFRTPLYLSGEESPSQIKMRADRLKIKSDISVMSGGLLDTLELELKKHSPDLLIVDSIQTVFLSRIPSMPGSLVQVRECGIFLQKLAKKSNVPIVIVGHVTKEGSLAGPRMLEHLVDVVLYLEGERFHDARVLRGVKNRFGSTNEVGIFAIAENGLIEIKNPSELFLKEREESPGSVVTAALEGTRPFLVEVQALVVPTHFGYPKRTTAGFDLNRLNLLSAVISKRTPQNLSNCDIYVNVAGGLKLREPAADLAICAAIFSSRSNKALPKNLCVFGEVGLSGEVRDVIKRKERENEAKNLGFTALSKPKNISEILGLLN